MKSLVIRATIKFPDGSKYYQENGWIDNPVSLHPDFEAHMAKELPAAAKFAAALGNKGGPLEATLEQTADGVKQLPDVHVTGITYEDLVKFEKHAHIEQGKIIALGEHHAKAK